MRLITSAVATPPQAFWLLRHQVSNYNHISTYIFLFLHNIIFFIIHKTPIKKRVKEIPISRSSLWKHYLFMTLYMVHIVTEQLVILTYKCNKYVEGWILVLSTPLIMTLNFFSLFLMCFMYIYIFFFAKIKIYLLICDCHLFDTRCLKSPSA